MPNRTVEIPWERLSPEALRAVLEEFATRDGTDWSDARDKVGALQKQLNAGLLRILFDPEEGTCQVIAHG